jgi:DnaJ homolog subfamily C member 7
MFLTGKLPQAGQHAASALRLDPGNKPAMQLRKRVKDVERLKEEGNVAFKSGKLEEAVALYGEALEVRRHHLFFGIDCQFSVACWGKTGRR